MKVILQIEGMECEECVRAVRESLEDLSGVESVKVDLAKALAYVEGDDEELDIPELIDAVEVEGYGAKILA